MKSKEERDQTIKDLGLNICAGPNKEKAFGIDRDWKLSIGPTVKGMMEEFVVGHADTTEFVLSIIALGETESQRLYLAVEAGIAVKAMSI